ncbi:MAG: hypothetical protein FKGGLIKP_00033 [Sodalis sp. Fse]|nr:MAG: hypothetical protein FKGGLIKP_00033 [Sodalis sp. Fse]
MLNQIRCFSWSFIVSAWLHTLLVVCLFYARVSTFSKSVVVEKSISVMLVTLELQQVPPTEPYFKAEFVHEPPVQVQRPKTLLKSKSAPYQEVNTRLQKAMTLPEKHILCSPMISPARDCVKSVMNAPRAISRVDPIYPERARAMGMEGSLVVMYDVDGAGRVKNVRILSAQPRNMFERDVRLAMRSWIYETSKPADNLTLTFKFNLRGVMSSEE